jgi:hypothetical protein
MLLVIHILRSSPHNIKKFWTAKVESAFQYTKKFIKIF